MRGGTAGIVTPEPQHEQFQSTLPVRGGTQGTDITDLVHVNFNPPSPCGEGLESREHGAAGISHFNPPSPCGEGRIGGGVRVGYYFNFNPPSPCGEGLYSTYILQWKTDFNPPSPCGEGPLFSSRSMVYFRFQSTLPVRGGTMSCCCPCHVYVYFNPPSPCGEGQYPFSVWRLYTYFNPPSPCGEGLFSDYWIFSDIVFQSTLPVRGGTSPPCLPFPACFHFNPPSPCGEGRHGAPVAGCRSKISIHPPRAGRDGGRRDRRRAWQEFQSTLPVRGGTPVSIFAADAISFQSTLPVRGGT